ncbi:MAG: hypothetical protein IJT63_05975 [Lachnospiraceae bacterium]|nr:hypothetical protein [Lachnospiraceae bacterium]
MTGCDIVLTKWIALKGTSLIAEKKENELLKEFSGYFINIARCFDSYLSVQREREIAEGFGVLYTCETGEGGIYKALWEMGEELGVGFEVELKAIPVKQETIEIANFFDIDPYKLLSGGSLLLVTEKGHDLSHIMQKNGINAAVIGKTNDTKDRVILNDSIRRFICPRDKDEILFLKPSPSGAKYASGMF